MRKTTMKQGALALVLLGGAVLFAGHAFANSFDAEGDFGGGYQIIGPGGPERTTTYAITSSVPMTSVRSTRTATVTVRRGVMITTLHPSTMAPASISADRIGVPIWTN